MVESGDALVDWQCRDHQHSSMDRISMLPDELLVFILSFLPLKEAAATSILSHRWRYSWTFTPTLDFDSMQSLWKVDMAGGNWESVINEERSNYIRWVDHVIALHRRGTIEDFRVYFNLTKTYGNCIDKWVEFALARKVKRLELNLTYEGCRASRGYEEYYTFPYKYLPKDKENCSNRWLHFKYLEKISMDYVNVNGEALEFFLLNYPLLEHLSISSSGELSSLKIIGPFPSLKRLEIMYCQNLDSVAIRDVNLLYLKYVCQRAQKFVLKNVPLLVEISTGVLSYDHIEYVLPQFCSVLAQLEILEMYS